MANVNVFVVEDEKIVARDIQDALKSLGYGIAGLASSGEDAIKKVTETKPDLILMDVMLDGQMDGIEAADRIRTQLDLPIVYLTALADEDTLQRAKVTEPFGYVLKPFVNRVLHATIEMALYKHSIEKKIRANERWLGTILRSIGDAVIVIDNKGAISFMNAVAEAKTGWKQNELQGKDLIKAINVVEAEQRKAAENPLKQALSETGIVIGAHRNSLLIARDGREIPIDISAVPIRDEKGEITGRVVVFRDVTERKRAEEVLKKERDFISTVIDTASALVIVLDREGRVVRFNRACEKITGHHLKDVNGRYFWDLFAVPEEAEEIKDIFSKLRDNTLPVRHEHYLASKKGAQRLVAWSNTVLLDKHGDIEFTICTGIDITERKRAEIDLIRSRDFYLTLLDEFPNYIRRSNIQAQCDYINRAWSAFTGKTFEHEKGEGWLKSVSSEDMKKVREGFTQAFNKREQFEMIYRLKNRDGEYRWVMDFGRPFYDLDGNFSGYINSCHDITDRMLQEQQLSYIATHDSLTKLPNRLLFKDRLAQAMREAERRKKKVAVMFLDLDRFKLVNDVHGHEAGDSLLKSVSERLGECLRDEDTVARLGGDEFIIALTDVADAEDAARVAQRIVESFSRPFMVSGREFFITTSIGISVFPLDDREMENMLKNADMAMYRAKEQGRNTYQFFTIDLHRRVAKRLALENSLRHALERKELKIYYQPQVDIAGGNIVGMEALMRWNHPDQGIISPTEFIPLAEDTGLIVPMGEWILHTACEQSKVWESQGIGPLRVAVNLSSRQFKQKNLIDKIRAILKDTSLNPKLLEIEITESLLLEHDELTIWALNELKAMGIHISMDDFGTGYSSLSYLKRFPISTIKIGQTFVRDITRKEGDAELASAIIHMIHSLRMRSIAEGVETAEQLSFLQSRRCMIMQGFYFSEPLPLKDLTEFLKHTKGMKVP